MQTIHQLKTWPAEFAALRQGVKGFEHRKNDRNFKTGEILELREFDEAKFTRLIQEGADLKGAALEAFKKSVADRCYTGEIELREIAFVEDNADFGIQPGYVILGLKPVTPKGSPDVTAELLAEHHIALAQKAAGRAHSYRLKRLLPHLQHLVREAEEEAAFHYGAAALVGYLDELARPLP